MNMMNRLVVLAGALSMAGSSATAQITITAGDVADQLTINYSITNVSDTLTRSVNIGSTGSSSWDFSGLLWHEAVTLKSVAVATTPYASQYPGATHAMQTQIDYQGIAATGYIYLILGTDFLNPGTMGGPPPIPGFKLELKIVNSPPDVTYALPSTYGKTWTSAYTETQTILLNGSPSSTTVTTYNDSYIVDAYGPMKIPGGSTHDVLRIRKKSISSKGAAVKYIFLAKNGASVQAVAADTSLPSSGTIAVSPPLSWSAPVNTAVSELPGLPQQFGLEQNYPNPFNPATVVRGQWPVACDVKLAVYDMLGREVARLADGRYQPGVYSFTFDAAGLSSGVYLYRLTAGDYTASRVMVLVR